MDKITILSGTNQTDKDFFKNFFGEANNKSDFLMYLDRRFSKVNSEVKTMKFGVQQFMDDTDPCLNAAVKDIGDLQARIGSQ